MYEEICEGGRSVLARATNTLEEETSTAGNHQVIGSYVEMLGRKRKRGTEVDEGARHKLPKHDVSVVIRMEASDNEAEGRANRKGANPFVFIEHDVEFIKKRKLDLVKETGAKTSTVISSDADSLSVCGMIDECDAPSVYQTMRRFDFRDSVGGRSTSQIVLVSVKDAIVKPLRVAGLARLLVPFSLVGEMRVAIVSLKDKGIHLMKYPRMWKVKSGLSVRLVSLNINGFRGQRLEYFEILKRPRPKVVMVQETLWSNQGVLLGISMSHIVQRIPGIKGKLVEALAQLDEKTIKFMFILSSVVMDFSRSCKSLFGNDDKTWSSIDRIIVNPVVKGFVYNARVNRVCNISDHMSILGSLLSHRKRSNKNMSMAYPKNFLAPERLVSMQKEICYHNFWAPLANLEDISTMEAEEIATTFVETSKKIAVDLTLYKASNRRPKRFYLTPSILKEIRAKDLAPAEWHKATKKKEGGKGIDSNFNRNKWAKFLDKGAKIVASQNGREHWKWVRRLLSESLYAKNKLSAVRDETGNLLTSPDKVMQRWSEFYTALSSYSTCNSRNPNRWIEILDNKKSNPLDINHDISWDEVRMVLMTLALHKAPGGDGL
ncbi:hypothetical protein AYI69_g4732 [Smittium culicis]|uniref:Endonuclease/exonuclease/phosphatase domain-containing protein n=1 Tax=Smittium culicis TaxID=133412 RepID=A0A1R1YBA6_9FUNG|nr:hypothetical protein AYI69_g4732 [Smittium culicis]